MKNQTFSTNFANEFEKDKQTKPNGGEGKILDLKKDKRSIPDSSSTAEEWESYLQTFEVPLTEELLDNPQRLNQVSTDDLIWGEEVQPMCGKAVKKVRKVLRILTPIERRAIKLKYWNGYSERQIAECMGVERGSARSYIQRAHQKIKEAVSKKFLKIIIE